MCSYVLSSVPTFLFLLWKVLEQIFSRTGSRQLVDMSEANDRHKFAMIAEVEGGNNEAAMQGKWRKTAFPERQYERLSSSNVVCAGLSSLDERSAIFELETSLPDSFVGLSYKYDDTGASSEGWMKSVVDETSTVSSRKKKRKNEQEEEQRATLALAADDGVVRAQVRTTMDILLITVQDRVMTDMGVLEHDELRSANWEDRDEKIDRIGKMSADGLDKDRLNDSSSFFLQRVEPKVAEQPVWGIDCYTRTNVHLCLQTNFDSAIATEFIENWLLPAINSCPIDSAHDIACAARILEGLPSARTEAEKESEKKPKVSADSAMSSSGSHIHLSQALAEKINASGPPWLKAVSHQLRIAAESLGESWFRIHPKGHGSVVINKEGLKGNTLVTHYRGEVYPPWRWGEKLVSTCHENNFCTFFAFRVTTNSFRIFSYYVYNSILQDAIEQTQKRLDLRPNLPDFYNMALERPRVDPRGFGLLFVDASSKAGLGSSFSHSCDPTCEVRVVAKNGQLSLAIATLRDLGCGEELTFDYNAVTESLHEYHYAICLCGHSKCRGSFLHFAAADCYQQILNRHGKCTKSFSILYCIEMHYNLLGLTICI